MSIKRKIKKVAKKILGEDLKGNHVEFNMDNASIALKDYIKMYPDALSSYKKIGRRKDNKDFYPAVKKIEDGYDLLYRDLHKYDHNGVTELIEYYSVRSGTPMRTKAFPMCKEYVVRMLMSKYLYRYPAITDKSLGCINVINYLVREGFQEEKSEGYDGLGIENIVFTYSTTHAFNMILQTICRDEDIVLMTGPNYGLFAVEPEKLNARVEILDLSPEDDWYVNPDKLAKKIDELNSMLKEEYKNGNLGYIPKVVAFLNMNPHNPLGKVMNSKNIDILKGIGDVCLERGVFVLDDLIYRDLTFDQDDLAVPLASMPKYFNNTISLFGVSKSYGLAGVRAGFIVAPIPIVNGICDIIFSNMDSISLLQTQVIAGAFNGSNRRYRLAKRYFKPIIREYKYRLDLLGCLSEGIDTIKSEKQRKRIEKDIKKYTNDEVLRKNLLNGIPGVVLRKDVYPEAGFFAILDFTSFKGKKDGNKVIKNDADFVEYLYKETKIKCIMGLNMSWPNEEEIIARISYSLDIKDLIYNFELIGKAIKKLK
ncbi:MAG: pyridoxal phosphate-dependent aminotransferase [Clostridium sp.]|nr:pyridoxal phosphate-dependent aminotransferase [Clostridium sp.]MCM1444459.1 pyridoxal phosphate-dependent aminotransferase [Candidatus Amulumruptor caecigallinarius]